jgi:hypothetical protein
VCALQHTQLLVDYGNDHWPAHDRNVAHAAVRREEEVATAAARRAPSAVAFVAQRGGGGAAPV